jgi:hypothetical protein
MAGGMVVVFVTPPRPPQPQASADSVSQTVHFHTEFIENSEIPSPEEAIFSPQEHA